MSTLDTSYEENSLARTWEVFGKRMAVAAGSATALVALLYGVPVEIASLRGGLACLGVLIVTRIAGYLQARLPSPPPAEEPAPPTEDPV